MKTLISLYTAAAQSKRMVYHIFATSIFLFLLSSCAKDVPDQDNSATTDQVIKTFPKSDLPDNYINGETVPEILVEIDKALKPAELEHRTSDKLPFKVLGYDKTRALRIYNDSFEITSYSFLAFTDLTDLNKVVNIVVTQKKNGKPGKPYLYEYTYTNVPNNPHPFLTKIIKYKFNGVKIDLPGANFDPCIDVVCDQYTLPAGSGGSGSGSSGGGGGYTGGSGSTYSASTSGGGFVSCTTTSYGFVSGGGSTYTTVYTTNCSDGSSYNLVVVRENTVFTNCCEKESVDIGVVTWPKGYNTKLSYTVNRYLESKSVLKSSVNTFLFNQIYSDEAHDHVENQVLNMMTDAEYEQLVMSSFSFTPIMWEIAKEIVGDKAAEIVINKLIPGLSDKQKIIDAVKACKNGDWIEFGFEVGKLIGQNTPIGKIIKLGEAGSEMYVFIKKVEKLHSRISTWSTTKTTQIWNIVKKNIKLASNSNYWKYVDDLASPRFGPYFATKNTYAQNYRTLFYEVANDIQAVHHAIPQAVLTKYPNLNISQDMMHSLENLRGIPSNGSVNHQTITNSWTQFYNNYPNATLQQLIDKAKEIDNQYGHLFVPPIR
ncbi:MAG: hypothetical protein IPK35_08800 [Saprospiraceae bacterium]|jgi:hypothetical protein|nr:hypothetical protein [Saprospiraceae bacterium]